MTPTRKVEIGVAGPRRGSEFRQPNFERLVLGMLPRDRTSRRLSMPASASRETSEAKDVRYPWWTAGRLARREPSSSPCSLRIE